MLGTPTLAVRDLFSSDLRLAEATARKSVSRSRSKAQDSVWDKVWLPFMASLGRTDPFLEDQRDKIPFFQVLAARLRDGRSSRSHQPIRGKSVSDEILSVAKTFTELGAPDPRFNVYGLIDSRLRNLFTGMTHQDPPPNRVKPCPIQVLYHAQALVTAAPTVEAQTTITMAWIGFFYLLRTGEHVKTSDNTPLTGKNVSLSVGNRRLAPFACPITDLDRATQSSVEFDTQKNRVRGEIIAHGNSGHSVACPTRALARRIKTTRETGGDQNTPLCAYKRGRRWLTVSSDMLTKQLRTSVAMLPHLGIKPSELTARSLRAGGAMALLCGRVGTDIIKLVGRWRSDAMFRYLHAQALPITHNLARIMVTHGAYTLIPGAFKPAPALQIINDAEQEPDPP